ncbi:MAG: hypothetical protein HHJ16_04215 [Polaromonas sp.]|uniref:hypothetical protein n=1 Tax=Polaromonas sp. TaxID=1869339 RepID=UPI0018531F43|nr:hypothetical protein [Polaromonas sp.]NMM09459.1 hypothetical protein [Polaromonas sp.]
MKQLFHLFVFVSSWFLAQALLAQSPTVTSQLLAQRVETVDGKTILKPASEGKPGDAIEYSGTYRNGSASGVEKLLATIPVPPGTTFIGGSAKPAQGEASTDGTRFAAMPLVRVVSQPDGSKRKEAVPLSEYRALRWEVGTLKPGGSAQVSLRVRIDEPPATSSAKL